MFPATRYPRLARALDLALEFATLGEMRLEYPAEPRRSDEALLEPARPPAAAAVLDRPPPFAPATAAGRRALDARREARIESRSPACTGGRGSKAVVPPPPRRRDRPGTPTVSPQPCLWAEG
jgi:hypothetical protein